MSVDITRAVATAWRAVGPRPDPRTNNAYSGLILGERVGDGPKDEATYFFVCKHCGQAVDRRDLGQVFHHKVRMHKRLLDN
jgi:hypothetical protein